MIRTVFNITLQRIRTPWWGDSYYPSECVQCEIWLLFSNLVMSGYSGCTFYGTVNSTYNGTSFLLIVLLYFSVTHSCIIPGSVFKVRWQLHRPVREFTYEAHVTGIYNHPRVYRGYLLAVSAGAMFPIYNVIYLFLDWMLYYCFRRFVCSRCILIVHHYGHYKMITPKSDLYIIIIL